MKVKCGVRGNTGPGCNAVGMLDRMLLGIHHLYRKPVYARTKVLIFKSCAFFLFFSQYLFFVRFHLISYIFFISNAVYILHTMGHYLQALLLGVKRLLIPKAFSGFLLLYCSKIIWVKYYYWSQSNLQVCLL